MTVKEAMYTAAGLLGIEGRVRAYLENGDTEGKQDAEALLRAFNAVENEIALDYLPLCAEDEVETETGAIEYSLLSNDAIRVVRVLDEGGNGAPFRLFPKFVKTVPGRVRIVYAYAPKEKSADDRSDFPLYISPRLFGYGMAAEYCLAAGLFEDAEVWDGKYKDALSAAYRKRPVRKIRGRRWA